MLLQSMLRVRLDRGSLGFRWFAFDAYVRLMPGRLVIQGTGTAARGFDQQVGTAMA